VAHPPFAMLLNEPGTRAELWDEAFLPALKDSKESVQQWGSVVFSPD